MRARTGLDKGPLARLTRAPVVAGGLLAALALVYVAWKRRRLRAATPDARASRSEPDPRVEGAAALYRALESALQLQGITRAPSTPPLRHAEDLRARRHPLGDTVMELTGIYLATRFGGQPITDGEKRDFDRRVRGIRAFRTETRAP